MATAAAADDWARVEISYHEAEGQIKDGKMPQKAFSFVVKTYKNLQGK